MTAMTLTQKFRTEYAKGIVPAMLKAIKAAKRDTTIIVGAVLAITYKHQAAWLSTIDGIGWLGWIIPAVIDLAMLRMLGIVQTAGMKRPAKRGALAVFGLLATMSAAVNIAAPGAVAARVIFGALVIVAASVKVVAALVGPDFDEMEATETAIQVAAPAVDEARKAMLSERARQGAATRKENAAKAEAKREEQREARRLRDAARRLAEAAPISPTGPATVLSAADQAALVAMDFPTR